MPYRRMQTAVTTLRLHRMQKYRRIAEDCLRLALNAKKENQRQAFLDLASVLLDRAGNDGRTATLRAEVEALQRPAN